MKKTSTDSTFIEVPEAELADFKKVFAIKGNKKSFMDSLPRTKAVMKKQKPVYTRRQLDYGLERGIMYQGLLRHLRAYYLQVCPPAPA